MHERCSRRPTRSSLKASRLPICATQERCLSSFQFVKFSAVSGKVRRKRIQATRMVGSGLCLLDRLFGRLGLCRVSHRPGVAVRGVIGGNLQPLGGGGSLQHDVLRNLSIFFLGVLVLCLGGEADIPVAPTFNGGHETFILLLRKLPDYDIQIGFRHFLFPQLPSEHSTWSSMQLLTWLCNYAAGGCAVWGIALGSLRRGRLFGWFAENSATTFAQAGPLLVHAGGDALHTRNFRRAKPKNIAGAKPALIVLRKCVARCRQHCQPESQPRCDLEITECEQIDWHSRPPGLTDVAADRQTLTAFESIHDCIDMNANASRLSTATKPKFCIGDHSTVANPHVEPAAFGAWDPREPGRAGRPRPPRIA